MTRTLEYKDIDLTFRKNPLTKDILVARNAEAVKKAMRNLVMTNLYETPLNPDKGSSIRASLFENFSPMTAEFLKNKLIEMLDRYEPRILVEKVEVIQRDDNNALEITIHFRIRNLQLQEQVTVFVERTR